MQASFVVRLLDADDQLLAWAKVRAKPGPQSTRVSCPLWPTAPTVFAVERDGMASKLSIHWTDLDIARVRDMPVQAVSVGQVFQFMWIEPVWLISGMRDVPLPSVTERQPVAIGVPLGSLATSDPR